MFFGLSPTSAALIIALGTAAGFGLGKVNVEAMVEVTRESYLNRYLAMSSTDRQRITYFLYARQADLPLTDITSIPGVYAIDATGANRLFDVVVDYSNRRQIVTALKQLPSVATVFTVPLMCH